MIFAGDKRSDEARTQVLFFDQRDGPLFGREGRPRQLLVLAGFAGYPRLVDFDGDARPDLVLSSLRPDLIDSLRSASTGKLDVETYVYLNRGGRFSQRPDLTCELAVPVEGSSFRARFFGDLTGDGTSELLLRDEPGRLRVLLVRRVRDSFQLFDRPLWELRIPEEAELTIRRATAAGPPELLVADEGEVLHVGFRR